MSTSEPPSETGTEATPKGLQESSEPEWARSLREAITELPGKVRASVTDDDKRGIAESVHNLFERSGAFERGEETPGSTEEKEVSTTEETVEKTAHEEPPEKAKGLARFAQWFEGK